jgi:toxin ParE1/3/4
MLNLVWRESARQELRQIFSYIAERDLTAAQRLAAPVEAGADRLPEHPFLYRRGPAPATREAVVHPNYILDYRVGTDSVEIVSLVHARQQYP